MAGEPTPAEPTQPNEVVFTAYAHARHAAAYLAADIAKQIPAGGGESVESRTQSVLAAADQAYAWLTQPEAQKAAA